MNMFASEDSNVSATSYEKQCCRFESDRATEKPLNVHDNHRTRVGNLNFECIGVDDLCRILCAIGASVAFS